MILTLLAHAVKTTGYNVLAGGLLPGAPFLQKPVPTKEMVRTVESVLAGA